MDFRAYASREAADLIDRLAKAAAAAAEDAAKRAADEGRTRTDAVKAELSAKAREAGELSAAVKHLQSQVPALQADVKAQRDRAESLQADGKAQRERAESLQAEVKAQRDRGDKAERSVAEARDAVGRAETLRLQAQAALEQEARTRSAIESELTDVRAALDETMRESERLSAQLGADATAKAHLSEQLAAVHAQLQTAEGQRQTLTTLYKASQVRVDALEKSHAEAERTRRELQARLDAAVASEATSKRRWETADRELKAAKQELAGTRASNTTTDTVLEHVLEAFEGLSGATTIADLLVALADMLGTQFARVALFRVKGNKLEGAYQLGFESTTDMGKLVVPLGMDSLLTRAASSGCIESIEGEDASENGRAPFGGSPTCALALPVIVQGETFGILYADNGASPDATDTATLRGWKGRFAELLLRHAVALLMRLTSELKALAEMREHAERLLHHVEEMYASDADGGVQGAELRARLVENLDCARRFYAQRAEVDGPAAAGLLEDQLAQLLEQQRGTPFGRDLAAIVDTASAAAS